jgi:hypothetical protein
MAFFDLDLRFSRTGRNLATRLFDVLVVTLIFTALT